MKRAYQWSMVDSTIHILIDLDKDTIQWQSIIPESSDKIHIGWNQLPGDLDCIILDQRESSREVWKKCLELNVPVIGLDEGGTFRETMDYLVDSLPNLETHRPNSFNPRILFPKIPSRGVAINERKKLLISFGNEDPGNLSSSLTKWILKHNLLAAQDITLVKGPLFQEQDIPKEIAVLEEQTSLISLMGRYSHFIGSFGISAYEAQASGCHVLLFNPSKYHESLTKESPFNSLGYELSNEKISKFKAFLQNENNAPVDQNHFSTENPWKIKAGILCCPICEARADNVLLRERRGTFAFCKSCGTDFFVPVEEAAMSYGKDYFFSDYKKQYGKTYLEDFDHIKGLGNRRAEIIQDFSRERAELRDLGCAFGPFLMAAKEAGFQVSGVDISGEAVEWVRQNLNVEAHQAGLLDDELDLMLKEKPVDVITLWYVIEHFSDQKTLLERLNSWLKPRGILAFSTPNGRGVSYRKNPSRFFRHSPKDHYIIYNYKTIGRVLKQFGFKLKKRIITGNHPNRIHEKLASTSWGFQLLQLISPIMGWGDTFEIYAEKVREL